MKRRDPSTGSLWHVFSAASMGGQGVGSSAEQKKPSLKAGTAWERIHLGQQCY